MDRYDYANLAVTVAVTVWAATSVAAGIPPRYRPRHLATVRRGR